MLLNVTDWQSIVVGYKVVSLWRCVVKAPEEWVRGLPQGGEQWALNYIRSIKGRDKKLKLSDLKTEKGESERGHLVRLVVELQKSDRGKLWFLRMDEAARKRKSKAKDPRKERRVLLGSEADKALRLLSGRDNLTNSDVVSQLLLMAKEEYVQTRDSIRREKEKGRSKLERWEKGLVAREQDLADREERVMQAEERMRALMQALRDIPEDVAVSLEFSDEDAKWTPVVRTNEKDTKMPEALQLKIQEAMGPYLETDTTLQSHNGTSQPED